MAFTSRGNFFIINFPLEPNADISFQNLSFSNFAGFYQNGCESEIKKNSIKLSVPLNG